jgi:hypothetical protein
MAAHLKEAARTSEYLVRDRDSVYGKIFTRRLRAREFGIGQLRPAHPGKMGVRNG